MKHIYTFEEFLNEGVDLQLSSWNEQSGTLNKFRLESGVIRLRSVLNLSRERWTRSCSAFSDGELGFETARDREEAIAWIEKAFKSGKLKLKAYELNEAANESTLEISGNAYAMWNDKKVQRELRDIKIKIVGDMKGVMTLSGDKEELNKVRAIFGIKESVVNEASKFKSTKDFLDFLEEIDGMKENEIKKIMGKDYIDTPGNYKEEAKDYDNDIEEYMISNMGKKEFEKLLFWWGKNVQESVVNERSKSGVSRTDWSKWRTTQNGDILMSKRQGVLAVRVNDVLRPLYVDFNTKNAAIQMDKGFDSDSQFTDKIEPNAKDIADAWFSLNGGGLNTKSKADEFGKTAEEEIKKLN